MHDSIERLRDAINSHDPRQVGDCFTPDYHCEVPQRPSESFVGSERVVQNWTAIFARLPDIRAEVLRRAAANDEIWSEWQLSGTGPDGSPAVLCGPVIMKIRDEQIAWARFYLAPVATSGGAKP